MGYLHLLDISFIVTDLEFFHLYFYLLLVTLVTLILVIISYSFAPARPDREKLASYECGFEPFGDARTNFDIHFYLVGILFLIFDLEVVFLYPWVFSLSDFNLENLLALYFFLVLLGVGFIFEWKKNALNWSPSL